jgi:hypothetical protein
VYAMCRPVRFQPYGERQGQTLEAVEATIAAVRHLADIAVHGGRIAGAKIGAGVPVWQRL